MDLPQRVFEDSDAVRQRVPLVAGTMGPSGGGKTFSDLRLATGIQRVTGGDIYFIDSESRRALHYADKFKFKHIPFTAPFSPLDYLAAIEHCVKKGAGVVIVDSFSHEHEGPGGVLEMHEEEVQRMSKGEAAKAERVKMLAWAKPKAARRRLINTLLQLNLGGLICSFRAKEKIKMIPGKEPEQLGWMPIAGEEFLYEMTVNFLLPPNAGGVPKWDSEFTGERSMMKLPIQFRELFKEARPLDESHGEAMAKWAAGDSKIQTNSERNKDSVLKDIKDYLVGKYPTQSDTDKESKAAALDMFFGSRNWKQVTEIPSSILIIKLSEMKEALG